MTQDLLPDEKPTRYRNFVAKIAAGLDAENGPDVIATITCDSVDADNEVVLPGGADLSRYVKSPRVMLCHAHGRPGEYYPLPVGKALWTKRQGNALVQGIRFARSSEMGREVLGLFAEGMLNTFSIGFTSIEASAPTTQEKAMRPDWSRAILIHRRWRLLEVSVVPIPSNPDAIGVYQRKGRRLPAFLWLPQSHVRTSSFAEGIKGIRMSKPDEESGRDDFAEGAYEPRPGDHVKMRNGGCGEVVSIHKSGRVPGAEGQVEASEDAPAARVALHQRNESKCVGTGVHKGVRFADLVPFGDESERKALDESSGTSGGYAASGQRENSRQDRNDNTSDDESEPVGKGHFVKWGKGSGMPPGCGKVVSIHRTGKVPGVSNDCEASEERPAARIKCYKTADDIHHYVETDQHVGVHVVHLTRLNQSIAVGDRKTITLVSDDRGTVFLFRDRVIAKGAVPFASGPVVQGQWDAAAARARLKTWANGDFKKYEKGFAWCDASKPDDYGSYKFPHHDVRDGELVVVKEGVIAALGALNGARGSPEIPASDIAAVRSHLEHHREEFASGKPATPKTIPSFRTREQVLAGIERRIRERFDAGAVAARAVEIACERVLGVV